ncbi:MAG: class I SAM-dependent methyltransferase [Microthrixaceae bacterium]
MTIADTLTEQLRSETAATPQPEVKVSEAATADDVAERIFGSLLGAFEIQAVYLGDRLGWYEDIVTNGPVGSAQLAERTASSERYAREWLEQQAATGYLVCDNPADPVEQRRFRIEPGAAEALTDSESLAFMGPFARFSAGLGKHIDALAEAYRTGGGVSWAELGEDPREAQAAANRPLFLGPLGREFLPSIREVDAALAHGGKVADIGCGFGWSTVGVAEAYPAVKADGFDIDSPSIDAARRIAEDRGLADRLSFHDLDAAEAPGEGTYDLVTAFECIHDMGDPVSVLAAMKRLVSDEGTVIVMDERVGDSFVGAADEVEQLFYGFSLMCCLADGLSHDHSVGTGTVMRADTLETYARAAGFESVEVLDIEHDFFRFYRLVH